MNDALERVAEYLGVAAEKVWETLLAQAQVHFICWWVGFFITVVLFIWWARKAYTICTCDRVEGEGEMMVFIFFGILLTFLLMITVVEFYTMLTCYMNPDYFALGKIQEILKGL